MRLIKIFGSERYAISRRQMKGMSEIFYFFIWKYLPEIYLCFNGVKYSFKPILFINADPSLVWLIKSFALLTGNIFFSVNKETLISVN